MLCATRYRHRVTKKPGTNVAVVLAHDARVVRRVALKSTKYAEVSWESIGRLSSGNEVEPRLTDFVKIKISSKVGIAMSGTVLKRTAIRMFL